ncbi:MAG: YcaO-like family protein [Promethearchaeota archaeon]
MITREKSYLNQYLLSEFDTTEVEPGKRAPPFNGFLPASKEARDKCLPPNETLEWTSKLLRGLFHGRGIKIVAIPFLNPYGFSWVVVNSVYHGVRELFHTSGKGATVELAMASAYGEMMERVQVGRLFSRNPWRPRVLCLGAGGSPVASRNDIDEASCALNEECRALLRLNNPDVPWWDPREERHNQFLDLQGGRTVWIDHTLVDSDTTGCAAGNTYEEAFVQALCEIFERYSVGRVLRAGRAVPTIPVDAFSRDNRDRIARLEGRGYEVRIKDFSLGTARLPCLAVLCSKGAGSTRENHLKIAAATSPDTALERALNELMQDAVDLTGRSRMTRHHVGRVRTLYRFFPWVAEAVTEKAYFLDEFARRNIIPSDYVEFLKEDTPDVGEEAGGRGPHSYWDSDCAREAKHLLDLCHSNGWRVFLKDYNWLGFPTLRLFVPELQMGYFRFYHSLDDRRVDSLRKKIVQDPTSVTPDDLAILRSPNFLLGLASHKSMAEFLGIETRRLSAIDPWFYIGLLAKAAGLGDLATRYLKFWLSGNLYGGRDYKEAISAAGGILSYIRRLVPDCTRGCAKCRDEFRVDCKYLSLRGVEEDLVEKLPEHFDRVPPWD